VGVFVSGAVLAFERRHQTEGLVAGIWVALADYGNAGVLYPPVFDGERFGGTRYMPLSISMYAVGAGLTGDYLTAGHYLGFGLMACLLMVLAAVLFQQFVPLPVALTMAATVLATDVGRLGAAGIRFEALPTVLQIGAVVIAMRPGRVSAATAAGLCALAIASKATALFAPLAIGLWLAWRDRRAGLFFACVLVAQLGIVLAAFELVSGGRMSQNLVATLGSQSALDLITGIVRVIRQARTNAGQVLWLVPFAAIGFLLAIHRRSISLVQISLVVALTIAAVVMTDPGAGYNHLLDVTVLVVLVAGEGWRRWEDENTLPALFPAALVVVVLAVLLVWPSGTRELVPVRPGAQPPGRQVAALVAGSGPILSEDAAIPVLAGHHPVVLDPYMLVRLGEDHPDWYASLVRRVKAGQFRWVITLQDLGSRGARQRYQHRRFGAGVHDALLRGYRLEKRIGSYWIYVPKS
jgi:hypothetical protein